MAKGVFLFLALFGLLALLMPGHGLVSRPARISSQAPGPPPFTFDKSLPDSEAFVHLPPFMVANLDQTHTWWARATGGDLEITPIAWVVSAAETGSMTLKVYGPAGFLMGTRTVAHPEWPAQEAVGTPVIISAAPGDLHRIEVTVDPTPPLGAGQIPAQHYRIKLARGSLLGTNSPLQMQAESDSVEWGVNVNSGESLDVMVDSVPVAGAEDAAVNVFRPDDTLYCSFAAGTSLPISIGITGAGSNPGMWTVGVRDATGHYVLEKTSGADLGLYVNWMSWGTTSPAGTLAALAISITDAGCTPAPLVLDVTDTVSVSDAAETLAALVLDVTDTVSVSDAAETLPPLVLDVTDTVSVSDAAETLAPLVLDVSDTVSVSDASETESHTDEDGVSDDVEDGASNGGDGNNDGTPDSEQDNGTSQPDVFGRYATIASATGTTLSSVETRAAPAGAPSGVSFPAGVFQFTVNGLTAGASTTVTLTVSKSISVTTYNKYGPTPSDTSDHWYEFMYDGTTGAVISGNEITLHLVDGQRGDHDLKANGEIVEPGGPGQEAEGGFPVGIIIGAVVGAGLLAVVAGYMVFRVRRRGAYRNT